MKAAVYQKYGAPEVVTIKELPRPVPKANELLIKICATTVTSGDARLRASDFPPLFWLPARLIFGLFRPKKQVLGHEFSGRVEAVGEKVIQFKPGDAVFGTTTMLRQGAHTEYISIPEKWKSGVVAHAPKSIDLKLAAALPIGAMTALFLLEKAGIAQGQNVLIYGASGSVGTYAVQMAKHLGAEVAGVCSTVNVDMVRSLGAQQVIDYKKEDYTASSEQYDIVFDAVGKTSKTEARKVLKKNGKFVSISMLTAEKTDMLIEIGQMVDKGALKPVIDQEFTLDQIQEVYRLVDSGRKKGNVLIRISNNK